MAPDDPGVVAAGTLANNHEAAFTSGSAGITTYDPIHAAVFDPAWPTTVCTPTPAIGPSAAWLNPHAPLFIGHPWAGVGGALFQAPWINAWNGGSVGPGGHNWSKYSMSVSGTGQHVVQLLADNCSWVYLDNALVAIQPVSHGATWGTYPLELSGTHQLTFIIFDGGGAAGGKFRLETRQSWITHGGNPALLPPPLPPADVTPPTITPVVTGQLTFWGWYNSPDPVVSWTVADGESPISSSSGCSSTTVNYDTPGVTFTCTATSAGGTATASVTVKRDNSPPIVTWSGNAATYTVDQQVTATCSASDPTSGILISNCTPVNQPAYTFGLGTHLFFASATNGASMGGSAEEYFTVTVNAGSLCELVKRFVSQKGIANSMCQQLANGAYGAFRNHVNAQTGKAVSAANAAILLSLAGSL